MSRPSASAPRNRNVRERTPVYVVLHPPRLSQSAEKNVAMMGGAYFVGKAELLEWLNTTFDLDHEKVEDCSNGHERVEKVGFQFAF